ncbi:UNVERIFIED_CONTAM: hypothetical protein DES50_103574, partial [Williamsia faeni]
EVRPGQYAACHFPLLPVSDATTSLTKQL